jgi:protein Mpv17
MWSRYLRALETRPILTKSITSATLYVGGDALAQKLDGTLDRTGYDVARGRTALIWGGLLFAPIAHGWYNKFLNPLIPGSNGSAVWKKVLLDQTVWACASNAAYLTCSNMLMGKSFDQSKSIAEQQFWPVMNVNWMIWPAIQVINFRFVPPPLQVPVINVNQHGTHTASILYERSRCASHF